MRKIQEGDQGWRCHTVSHHDNWDEGKETNSEDVIQFDIMTMVKLEEKMTRRPTVMTIGKKARRRPRVKMPYSVASWQWGSVREDDKKGTKSEDVIQFGIMIWRNIFIRHDCGTQDRRLWRDITNATWYWLCEKGFTGQNAFNGHVTLETNTSSQMCTLFIFCYMTTFPAHRYPHRCFSLLICHTRIISIQCTKSTEPARIPMCLFQNQS